MKKVSINKISLSLEDLLFKNTLDIVTNFLPDLKQSYKETYETELLSIDVPDDSLANPMYFYEDFSAALDDFTYVTVLARGETKIIIPDEDTFPFYGRLHFLQWVTSGVVGNYYEISKIDYNYLINYDKLSTKLKNTLIDLPGFLSDEENELDFYLLDISLKVHEIFQNILKKKLVVFPFSNTPAIDLFSPSKEFFNSSKDIITTNVINKSLKDLRRSY